MLPQVFHTQKKIHGILVFTLFLPLSSFFMPKQPKNLDPSYKTYLDLWDCLGGVKLVF